MLICCWAESFHPGRRREIGNRWGVEEIPLKRNGKGTTPVGLNAHSCAAALAAEVLPVRMSRLQKHKLSGWKPQPLPG